MKKGENYFINSKKPIVYDMQCLTQYHLVGVDIYFHTIAKIKERHA